MTICIFLYNNLIRNVESLDKMVKTSQAIWIKIVHIKIQQIIIYTTEFIIHYFKRI